MNHLFLEAPGEGAVTLMRPPTFMETLIEAGNMILGYMRALFTPIIKSMNSFTRTLERYPELVSRKLSHRTSRKKSKIRNIRSRKTR